MLQNAYDLLPSLGSLIHQPTQGKYQCYRKGIQGRRERRVEGEARYIVPGNIRDGLIWQYCKQMVA